MSFCTTESLTVPSCIRLDILSFSCQSLPFIASLFTDLGLLLIVRFIAIYFQLQGQDLCLMFPLFEHLVDSKKCALVTSSLKTGLLCHFIVLYAHFSPVLAIASLSFLTPIYVVHSLSIVDQIAIFGPF